MKAGIVIFPGSNCDHDAYHLSKNILNWDTCLIWHKETSFNPPDLLILPGGFSYGDYLRSGAMASKSPVMGAVIDFAKKGGYIIGICNGFQVLTESGILEGALIKNKNLRFLHQDVYLRCENHSTVFTEKIPPGKQLKLKIAHGDGNYIADSDTLKKLEAECRVAFKYASPDGNLNEKYNPNGSIMSIAGILSSNKRVLGMMPHPERCVEELLGSTDGKLIFEGFIQ